MDFFFSSMNKLRLLTVYFVCGMVACEVSAKCKPLLMCPSFCMTIQDGCYFCNCGYFTGYMEHAKDNMASVEKEQEPQTGTQLSTYTSGYGDMMAGTKGFMSGITNYKAMFNSFIYGMKETSEAENEKIPGQLADGDIHSQSFATYGGVYMPGMNCDQIDPKCPSPCWTTNVFTGCIDCACGDLGADHQTAHQATRWPTVNTLTYIPNVSHNHSTYKIPTPQPATPTPLVTTTSSSSTILPFKIPTTAPVIRQYAHSQRVPYLSTFMEVQSSTKSAPSQSDLKISLAENLTSAGIIPTSIKIPLPVDVKTDFSQDNVTLVFPSAANEAHNGQINQAIMPNEQSKINTDSVMGPDRYVLPDTSIQSGMVDTLQYETTISAYTNHSSGGSLVGFFGNTRSGSDTE